MLESHECVKNVLNAYFSAKVKNDRYRRIQPLLKPAGISLVVEPAGDGPLGILFQFMKQDRSTVFITNDWLKIPLYMLIARILKGNPYVLVLNGAFWKGWGEYGWSALRIRFYSFLTKMVILNCSTLICNSDYIRREINRQFPSSLDKTLTIYNGIEHEHSLAGGYCYSSSKLNILSISTFDYREKYEGLMLILEALSFLSEEDPHLYILASVNSDTGWRNFNQFKALVKEWFSGISIDFFSNVNVQEFFNPSRAIFVYSSFADSLPRSILEAQLAGMPSVVVDTMGCAEAVLPGRTALVVPPDRTALADAMRSLINSPTLRRQMTNEAPLFIEDRFSWENMAKGYSRVIGNAGKVK